MSQVQVEKIPLPLYKGDYKHPWNILEGLFLGGTRVASVGIDSIKEMGGSQWKGPGRQFNCGLES